MPAHIEVESFTEEEFVSLAKVDTEGMSFNEAFAAARAEVGSGGVFEWRGGYYGTYYENEWAEFSDEFKREFSNHNWENEFDDQNNAVDVELVADDSEHIEMSFVLDGEASMPEIMAEVYENLPGEILSGEFDIDVQIAEVAPVIEPEPVVEPDCIAEASEELYADADAFQSNMTTEDILADVDGADDILC